MTVYSRASEPLARTSSKLSRLVSRPLTPTTRARRTGISRELLAPFVGSARNARTPSACSRWMSSRNMSGASSEIWIENSAAGSPAATGRRRRRTRRGRPRTGSCASGCPDATDAAPHGEAETTANWRAARSRRSAPGRPPAARTPARRSRSRPPPRRAASRPASRRRQSAPPDQRHHRQLGPVAFEPRRLVAQQERRLDVADLHQRHDREQQRHQQPDGDALRRRTPRQAVVGLGQDRRRAAERERDGRDRRARQQRRPAGCRPDRAPAPAGCRRP